VPLQELESLVPLAYCLEFKAVEILVVVVGRLSEDLSILEEVLEDPVTSCFEHGDALANGIGNFYICNFISVKYMYALVDDKILDEGWGNAR
jgi:hypothetical protein